jgi:hypothetical protein
MTSNHSTTTSVPWTSGVEAMAAGEGVDQYLQPLVDMTRQVFPSARCLKVQVEDDPVIEDDWRIVFVIEAPLAVPDAVQAIHQWYERLFECCPPAQACFFRLGFRVVE